MPALKSASHRQPFAGEVNQVGQFVRIPAGPVPVLCTAAIEGVLDRDRQSIAEGITLAMIFAPGKVDVMDGSLGKNGDFAEIDRVVMRLCAGSAFGQGEIANVFILVSLVAYWKPIFSEWASASCSTPFAS